MASALVLLSEVEATDTSWTAMWKRSSAPRSLSEWMLWCHSRLVFDNRAGVPGQLLKSRNTQGGETVEEDGARERATEREGGI